MSHDPDASREKDSTQQFKHAVENIEDRILIIKLLLGGSIGVGLGFVFRWPIDVALLVVLGCIVLTYAYIDEERTFTRDRVDTTYAVHHGVASDMKTEAAKTRDMSSQGERKEAA